MRFSILTPSYGYGRFIGDAVSSVLGQRRVEVEHIVVDGASTDETVQVLTSLSADPRLQWVSEPDDGQSSALNKALSRAKGDWVGWLNADEFYLPDTLASVEDAIVANPRVDVLYGDFLEVDVEGKLLRLVAEHAYSRTALRGLRWCYIPSCTTFVRREAISDEPWDSQCVSMMDWDWFLEMAGAGLRFAHLRQPLAAFRRHPHQVSESAAAQTEAEYRLIRNRHGIPAAGARVIVARICGRGAHVLRKVGEGGYVRELRMHRRLGENLRWFDSVSDRTAASGASAQPCQDTTRPVA